MGIKIKVSGDFLAVQGASADQFAAIQQWGGKLKWNPKEKALVGVASMETLDKLAELLREDGLQLPPDASRRRRELHATREAVDWERVRPNPTPLVKYPLKTPLYEHQVRASNMALLTFGWVLPEGNH